MKSIVVTGVSTGIGFSSAKILIEHGFQVFGSVRKPADGERLKSELGDLFVPLLFDVTDEEAVLKAASEVRVALKGETLAGLVNNAGIAVVGPFLELPLKDIQQQINVNVLGLIITTRAFAPLLGADSSLKGEPGRIIMMSSVAGKNGNPFWAPYSASKHAIEGLSDSLRKEFMIFGIDVIVIGPGPIKTPIWDKAEEIDIQTYSKSPFFPAIKTMREYMMAVAKNGLPAEEVSKLVYHTLTCKHPRVRYTITPTPFQFFLTRILPKRWVDWAIAKRLGLLKRNKN